MNNRIYEKMIMDNPIPYFLIKGIKGTDNEYIDVEVINANNAFLNLSGLNKCNLKNFKPRYLREDRPILKMMNKSLNDKINEEKVTYEVWDDLERKYYNIDIYNIGDDKFWIRVVNINTDRSRLSNILKDSPFSVWIKDIDGRYIDVNKRFLANSGKRYSEIIGNTDAKLWGIEESNIYEQQDKFIIRTLETKTYTEIIKFGKECKERYYETTKWPYLDENNNIIGVMGITIEIVDNTELRQNLIENEASFKEIINCSEEVFFILENQDIKYVSPSFEHIFGKSPDKLLENINNVYEYVSENEIKKIQYDFKTSIDKIIKIKDIHEIEKYLWVKLAPIKDERGNTIRTIGIISDVSKRKKLELELEQIRMDFFGNLSHELRTPINLILGTMQLLDLKIDNLKSDDKDYLKKYNNIVKQNGLRLLKLVNNLIDTTRVDAGYLEYNPQNYDIINFVESICMSVCDFAKQQQIDLIFDTEIEENLITFDLDMMERIILNLLSNAIKFNKKNGIIEVYITRKGEYLNISVKDSGVGIPKEKLEVIFGRFEQVNNKIKSKKEKEGSGIGLSLVKSLIELHEGTISVNSALNEGTEFIISIPNMLIESNKIYEIKDLDFESQVNRMNVEFSDIYK